MKPPVSLELVWEHDLVFGGRSGDVSMILDSAAAAGPSPLQALAFGLAGCMAMDVVHILLKGRHGLRGLKVMLAGERAQENPHRFTAFTVEFAVTGPVPKDQIQRAIDLSHEKYCSVWHSLRQDITLDSRFTVSE